MGCSTQSQLANRLGRSRTSVYRWPEELGPGVTRSVVKAAYHLSQSLMSHATECENHLLSNYQDIINEEKLT